LQKSSCAKLVWFVGLTVQASARSPVVLIFKFTGAPLGVLMGTAGCLGKAKNAAKQKTSMNRIVHLIAQAVGTKMPMVFPGHARMHAGLG
jgi:hypothetical protein